MVAILLTHTDYALWEVIVNGDAPAIASASAGTEAPIEVSLESRMQRPSENNQGSSTTWTLRFWQQIDITDLKEMGSTMAGHQGNRNGDGPRKVVPVKTPANAYVVQDEIGGYNWSFKAEEGITNFDLMLIHFPSQINESEVVHSVFNSRESDVDDSLVNDRFKTGEGFYAVPPPYTGNYMPSRPDV
ncbi:hypothetical protein Tco_0925078 [Tanacetum coccineum]|uniref:Uncharacterized protein n=1 Tax=Tanacetum coccineum TaxID=301880 RepID=A0ABQ5DCT3_9ASTR